MSRSGSRAMVMAAGLGLRMRPLTLNTPKPLIPVRGKPLISYAFDHLRADACAHAIVNVHYLAEQIEDWARHQPASPAITISDERGALLDTGGGLVKALPLLGPDPFFVLNSDSFWTDAGTPALQRLREAWRDDMDCLLLLAPIANTVGYHGRGDFILGGDGRLTRRTDETPAPLVYIGAYLVHPRLFAAAPTGAFSMNRLWDRAIEAGRLFGLRHAGTWFHVGTPEAIGLAEQALDRPV